MFSLLDNYDCLYYHIYDNFMQNGSTPLHTAVKKNRKECLELLLSHGAEVNIKNDVSNGSRMNF